MFRLIPGTLGIFGTWLLLLVVFAGLGLLLRRGFGLTRLTAGTIFESFWIGFAVVVLFLIVWNFWFPIGGVAAVIVLAGGTTGLWLHRGVLAEALGDRATRQPAWAIVAMILVGLWVANLSIADLTAWDTALYHWQGVRWARLYPAVPGLANLFGPLGFNNSAFLYDAMLDVGPWMGRSYHLANGLFVFVFACQAAYASARLLAKDEADRPVQLFTFVCLIGAIQSMWAAVPSYVTDVATANVLLALTSCWYGLLTRRNREPLEAAWSLVSIVTLGALAVSLKMNTAVFAALAVSIAGALWLGTAPGPALRRKTLAWGLTLALAFGTAWTTRGIVLSGYPLFPSTLLAAPVEWRAPAQHAQAEFAYVVDSGRMTASNLPVVRGQAGMALWLPDWLRSLEDQIFYIPVPLTLLLIGLFTSRSLRRRAPVPAAADARRAWWMALPLAGALTAWFLVAPEPRYASPLFWSLAALGIGQALLLMQDRVDAQTLRRLVLAGWGLAAASIVVQPLLHWHVRGMKGSAIRAVISANVRVPPEGFWLAPRTGAGEVTPYQTRSGLSLNVPQRMCWDAPLPCTPNPAPNLRLRVAGRMDRGFTVDGQWEMVNWPEPWRPDYLPALRERLWPGQPVSE